MGSSSKPQLPSNLLGHRVAHGRLELVAVLGVGAYGVVYLARDLHHPLHADPRPWDAASTAAAAAAPSGDARLTGLYAVKCLHSAGLEPRQQLFQEREIALHSLAGAHPGVVTLYQVLQDSSCLYVVMDYCSDGDLFAMITEAQRYAVPARLHPDADPKHIMTRLVVEDDHYLAARAAMDRTIKDVFCQIVDAVAYCHQLGIYHRDLKPENILCVDGGARVVIADFGLATSDIQSEDFGCGSTFYMGPECQGGIVHRLSSYDTAANDVWSLGVILVNLVCGRNPWKQATASDDTFREYLRNPNFLREILPISDDLNSILKRVFSPFPEKRCPISELAALVQDCDRLTATNADLQARQEARRRAQAEARQAAKAKAQAQAQAEAHAQAQAQAEAHAQAQAQAHVLALAQARAAREHAAATEGTGSIWRKPSQKVTGMLQESFHPRPTAAAAVAHPDAAVKASGSPPTVPHRIRTHAKTRSLCHPLAPLQGELSPVGPPAHHAGHARHASLHVPRRAGEAPAGLASPFQPQSQPPLASPSAASPSAKAPTPLSPSEASVLDSSDGWETGTPSTPTSSYSTASHTGLPPTPQWVAPTVPLPPVSPASASGRKGSMAAFSRIVQQSKNSLLELSPFPGRRPRRTEGPGDCTPHHPHPDEAWAYDTLRPPLSALGFVPDTRVGF